MAEHHPELPPRVMASMPLVVAETDQEARVIADPHLNRYLKVWVSALESWNETVSADYAQYTGLASSIKTLTAKDLRADGSAIVGSPDHVIEQIGRFNERFGVDGLLWQADFGGFGGAAARRSTELFAEKVRPQFARVIR
jgi:alkanesulfonate monooxygenase SsuD/methylene tetrahydromethanopterin reductase-like flavin-dependent oxidoreductase (luciferase family)